MQPLSKILIINGPNLNLLGTREPDVYGSDTLAALDAACRSWAAELGINAETFQSNHEGALIDRIHLALGDAQAIIINPGALTHYSYAILDALLAVGLPTVEVHISDVTRREPWRQTSVIRPACVTTIYGRGTDGYRDALRHLAFRSKMPITTLSFGPDPDQVADLRIPAGPGPHPVAFLFHGGFWRPPWQRDLMDGPAVDLVDRGVATLNVEYRRGSGRWKEALSDTANAIDNLPRFSTDYGLDSRRVAVVGHSAGGHLALWAAARRRLPEDSNWASPEVTPGLAVALAGIIDLTAATADNLGDGALKEFFGDPSDVGVASPDLFLPLGVPQLIVHGTGDERVPVEHSRAYVTRARAAGDTVEFVEYEGADHSVLIDETSPEWSRIADLIADHLASR